MQLSLQSDYALRTLMALAVSDRQLSVEDVARRYGISRNHLAKVAKRLQSEGYVRTFRGRSGGMRLVQRPERIIVGEVVRQFENLGAFASCFPAGGGCAIDGACGLRPALSGAVNAFLDHLDGFTLADLIPDSRALQMRLEQPSVESAPIRSDPVPLLSINGKGPVRGKIPPGKKKEAN